MSTRIVAIIILVVTVVLALVLFLPYPSQSGNLSKYKDSEYYPLIEGLDEYQARNTADEPKNNFQALVRIVKNLFAGKAEVGDLAIAPGGANMMENARGYLEVTDNQVAGVIEADLFKMTTDYIFRLGTADSGASVLRVYSVAGEASALVSEYQLSSPNEQRPMGISQMYLSQDGCTVTVLTDDYNNSANFVSIVSLDVTDVTDIKEKGRFTIEGSLNTTRMVDGKLIVLTEFYFNSYEMDYSDPSTFVPEIDRGDGAECIKFEDIIYPEEIGNTRYTVLCAFDAESLELLGANALLNFINDVYISENNIFITREYRVEESNGNVTKITNMSDIAVIDYSGERLEEKGVITVRGYAEDQYSFDEMDGYLRVVTSTTDGYQTTNGQTVSYRGIENVSLYIINLADNSLAYKVEDFAVEGDEATAVRFNGDKLYVCTAEVIKFTDPVYFFDLSDYENITYTDTGIIEGYSTSLIDYGEGILLGIGVENWSQNKVSIYEERSGSVVTLDDYTFRGNISDDYKAYMVNREENLFGFGIDYMNSGNQNYYVVLLLNGYELVEVEKIAIDGNYSDVVRAVYLDGYLYLTTPASLTVRQIMQ